MPAVVRVLCGPAGSGKTGRLARRYREAAAAPGAALWLGPTRRYLDDLRPRLAEAGMALLSPHLLTFQEFADELVRANDPGARPLSHPQRRLLVDEIVTELHGRGRLSHFSAVIDTRGFPETVFALIGELKQREVGPDPFGRALAGLAAAEGDGAASILKSRQCLLIYAEYQKRLARQHFYDPEGRLWYARDLLARGARRPLEAVRAAFVDGFTNFTATEQDILAALCPALEELWVTLPDEAGDDRAELFTRPRATLARLEALQPYVEHLPPAGEPRPAGLAHLERQLFRPLRQVAASADAAGLLCIEAPGAVGEARLVARQIKALLGAGVGPDDILVTMRDLAPYADLVAEVFAEYGTPVDVEGAEPLSRNPAVATLLRTLRLPEEDWPFAGVTALLRSGYFAPDWPESRDDPEVAGHAEALLRLLGEPRGREAYLRAVRRWSEQVQPGLEDEDAEESRRRRTHELARRCRPFLEHFCHAWDEAPARATPEEHAAWLRRLAGDLGLSRAAAADPRDRAALERFGQELDRWVAVGRELRGRPRVLDRVAFHRALHALAAGAGLARTPRGPGRVRVLSAELARHLSVPFLFVMGLGERSFPDLSPPVPLLDEAECQALKQAGLDFPCAADRLPEEMLLFYQVVTRARRGLVLSYPAVDDKGQALLPSSFLSDLRAAFAPGSVPVLRRRMLIEGYDRDAPLAPAEHRVQAAAALAKGAEAGVQLPPDLGANLAAAAEVARLRFRFADHTPYDGLFRDPAGIAELHQRFGPERVFSPTALEGYIACPFRFFLGHVLRLAPLEEPREEIEGTDRGLTFHRALSRLHRQLREAGIHEPVEAVDDHMLQRLEEAVAESARRAASPASEVLWHLEGQRLRRLGQRYRPHWKKFVDPWLPKGVRPEPTYFEVSFGLPAAEGETPHGPLVIRADGVEVRVSGRIDRVDVAVLPHGCGATHGFWVIDYKTGNTGYYTAADLKVLRRLQLALYALAVEEVLLAGKAARPLGLAYWMVADAGPKLALPAHPKHLTWLEEAEAWPAFRERLRGWVARLVAHIRQGAFPLKPRDEHCTQTCDFGQVCRISQVRKVVENKTWQLPLPMTD